MRTREVEILKKKLLALKQEYLDIINQSGDSITVLNSIKTSEEVDMGNIRSIAHVNENMLIRYNKDIKDVYHALDKIKSNQYGMCEMCGEQIDIKRLMAKPHAKFCISCREVYEKNNRMRSS